MIKELRIRNFRSIAKADITLNELSIFVGLNDVGKSNVLKALNLFFNGETDYSRPVNFDEDYCKHSPVRAKKAPEISIELIIKPPSNYSGNKDIRWIKTWRRDGQQQPQISFIDSTSFPKRSKLYSWLQNIRYTYIPAIRDQSYFEILLASLHDSLAETVEKDLRAAGEDFIAKIKDKTGRLIDQLDQKVDISSQIKFPPNLRTLFKTLDFSTNEGTHEVSLSNRGDGIKTKHIPIILKFISDQLNITRRKGSPNVNMLWGYEEPENNLEMLAAFKLAKLFMEYANQVQLLITTHSPGFYSLKEDSPSRVSLYQVKKKKGISGEYILTENSKDLNHDMGIMPIIAPYVKEKIEEIEELERSITNYEKRLAELNKNVLFVEGNDEVRVFEEIFRKKAISDKISVKMDGLGCTGVKNQLVAFSWVSGVAKYKAIGIFDNDLSGSSQFEKLKGIPEFKEATKKNKAKAYKLEVPSHLIKVKQHIGNFSIEIEEMYPYEIWKIADKNGWLEQRSIEEIQTYIKVDNLSQSIGEKLSSIGLSIEEQLYVLNKVSDKHKESLSKLIIDNEQLTFEQKFNPLIKFTDEKITPFIQ